MKEHDELKINEEKKDFGIKEEEREFPSLTSYLKEQNPINEPDIKFDKYEKNMVSLVEKRREVSNWMPVPKKKVSGYRGKDFSAISGKLADIIQVMVEDTDRGPRFKKVNAAAKEYMRLTTEKKKEGGQGLLKKIEENKVTDEQAAEALGSLYAAVVEYLMERKSKSKKSRKDACEAFAIEIETNFIKECDDVYMKALTDRLFSRQQEYKGKIKDNKDQKSDLFEEHMNNLEETLKKEYGISDDKEIREIKKKNKEEKKKGNPGVPTAERIKNLAEQVEELKKFNLPVYKGPVGEDPDIDEIEEADKKYERELASGGLMLTLAYNKLIMAIEEYMAYADQRNKNTQKKINENENISLIYGNNGMKKVKKLPFDTQKYEKLLLAAKSEMHTINSCITEFVAENRDEVEANNNTITWGRMIDERNKVRIHINETTKDVGAGTSNVYVVKRNEYKKQFVKPDDQVAQNGLAVWKDIAAVIPTIKGYKPQYQKTLDELDKYISKNQYGDDYGQGDDKELKNQDMALYSSVVSANLHYYKYKKRKTGNIFMDAMDENFDYRNIEDYCVGEEADKGLFDFLKTIRSEKDEQKKMFIAMVLNEYTKKFNSYFFSRHLLKLKPKASLASRNVATSRMAEFLGMSDYMPKAEMAKVDAFGKEKIQLVMDEAKGTDIDTLKKDVKYSVKGIASVTAVMVFDILCGQIDRNKGNYFVTLNDDDDMIDGMQLIDCDMSFGTNIDHSISKQFQHKPGINKDMVRALDPKIRKKIMAMDKAFIKAVFNDVLEEDAINDLISRLTGIQTLISEVENEIFNGLKNKDEEKRYHYYLLKNSEEYRSYWYMKSIKDRISYGKNNKIDYIPDNETYFVSKHMDLDNVDSKITELKDDMRARFRADQGK